MRASIAPALALAVAAPGEAAEKGYFDNAVGVHLAWSPARSTDGRDGHSVWAGLSYAYSPLPEFVWIGIGAGYAGVGVPGDGTDMVSIVAGATLNWPLSPLFAVFARAVAGPNIRIRGTSSWRANPLILAGHLGFRIAYFDLHAIAGLGPAEGFSLGIGLGASLGF